MKIEMMCARDPDGPCNHRVFVDGVEIQEGRNTDPRLRVARHIVKLSVENIDPGAGYSAAEWAETTADLKKDYRLTTAFRHALKAWRDAASESKYITEEE